MRNFANWQDGTFFACGETSQTGYAWRLAKLVHMRNSVRMVKQPPMSIKQAAEQTGVPTRTINYAISTGDLKAHKLPGATGAYLIDQRDLDRWIAKREAKANA